MTARAFITGISGAALKYQYPQPHQGGGQKEDRT